MKNEPVVGRCGEDVLVVLGSALLLQVVLGLVLGVVALRLLGIGGSIAIVPYVIGAAAPWSLVFFASSYDAIVAAVSDALDLHPSTTDLVLFWALTIVPGPLLYGAGSLLLKALAPNRLPPATS